MLLSAHAMSRLEAAQLSTRRPLAGLLVGEHRSPRHGSSVDFADHREYHPGDDPRRIDQHALARLDVLLIKLHEADDELDVRLIIDTSKSMGLHGKLDAARRIAAAIGFVALVRRDPVSVRSVPLGSGGTGGRRLLGRASVAALMASLERLEVVETNGLATVDGLASFGAGSSRRGLTVVVSDLWGNAWAGDVGRIAALRGEACLVHLLAPEEFDDGAMGHLAGEVELVDTETGRVRSFTATDDVLGRRRSRVENWRREIALQCERAGAAYLAATTSDDPVEIVIGAARRAGVVR